MNKAKLSVTIRAMEELVESDSTKEEYKRKCQAELDAIQMFIDYLARKKVP